jgi:ribosomal protein L32E
MRKMTKMRSARALDSIKKVLGEDWKKVHKKVEKVRVKPKKKAFSQLDFGEKTAAAVRIENLAPSNLRTVALSSVSYVFRSWNFWNPKKKGSRIPTVDPPVAV